MSAGLNRYLPYSTVGQTDASPYFFRSGFNGGIIFAEDLRHLEFRSAQGPGSVLVKFQKLTGDSKWP